MGFLSAGNLSKHQSDVDVFIKDIMSEIENEKLVWEPKNKATKTGFQTDATIFRSGKNCNVLEKIKTKAAGVADRAQHFAFVPPAHGLAGIFQHQQLVPPRHSHNRLHIARQTPHMHRDHRLRPRADSTLQILGMHIQTIRSPGNATLLGTAVGIILPEEGPVPENAARQLLLLAIAILAANSLRGIFAYGQQYLGESIAQRVAYDLRNEFYDHLPCLPI